MSEKWQNLIVSILILAVAFMTWRVWKRRVTGIPANPTPGDIYVAGGTPAGSGMTIPDPDNGSDQSGGQTNVGILPLIETINSQSIGG